MTDSDLFHSEPSSTRPTEALVDTAGDDPLRSADDSVDSFWGAEWEPRDRPMGTARLTGPLGRWWHSMTEGRTRAAAVRDRRDVANVRVDAESESAREVPEEHLDGVPGEVADERTNDGADDGSGGALDGWPAEWSEDRPRPGVDPLLARLGGLAVVVTLLVPVMLGFASDSGDTTDGLATTATPIDGEVDQLELDPDPSTAAAENDGISLPNAAGPSQGSSISDHPSSTDDEPGPVTRSTAEALTEPATAPCGADYEIAVGDFWIRIADGARVDVDELLDVNDATSSTPLYPGRTICLPTGASTPPPPPSSTAATESAVVGGTGSTGTSSDRPAVAPTVTAPPPPAPPPTAPPTTQPPLDAAGVQAVIRAVWPDELEERALEIAWRESNYRPTARNSCCYGVFQIYWDVHRSWLGDLGITSAEGLYDPTLNARAALALYERAGGWGPWGG